MEYDTSTMKGDPLPGAAAPQKNSAGDHRGYLRAQSKAADVAVLKETVTLPFSGRTAKNRFLKAPMTERLCHWNKEGEDIVLPPPDSAFGNRRTEVY